MKVLYIHNIFWSRYRLDLFDSLSGAFPHPNDFFVLQIAETENIRQGLVFSLDLNLRHNYHVLHDGAYEDFGLIKKLFNVCKWFYKSDPSVVVCTGYACSESWLAFVLCFVHGRKFFLTLDSSLFEYKKSLVLDSIKRFMVSRSAGVLAYGSSSAHLAKKLGAHSSRVFSPFHSVQRTFYISVDSVLAHRRQRSERKFVFLFVGRLAYEKGVLDLLECFNDVFSEQENVLLRLVGNGPLIKDIHDFVSSNHCVNIEILGALSGDALLSSYLNADCLVLPSTLEPWGLVVNEALCLGCPVLVSDRCGCTPDLVDGNPYAVKFPAADKERLKYALRECLKRFIDFDETRVRHCVEVGNSFSLSRCVESFFAAISSSG